MDPVVINNPPNPVLPGAPDIQGLTGGRGMAGRGGGGRGRGAGGRGGRGYMFNHHLQAIRTLFCGLTIGLEPHCTDNGLKSIK